MYINLNFYGCHIHALVDTGASRTVLRRDAFELLCRHSGRTPILRRSVTLCGITGHNINVLGYTDIKEQHLGKMTVIVAEGISQSLIIGSDVLSSGAANIDYETEIMRLGRRTLPLIKSPQDHDIDSLGERPPIVTDTQVSACVKLNADLFSAKGENLGCHPDIAVRIETSGPPIKRRPYRLPLTKRAALDKKINELLAEGVIVPSASPWASPVVLVEKKDPSDGPRFCIDFTQLNRVTKKDAYPIPLIRDIFDQLQGATVFSTIDLKSGFHQLPLHPVDQEKTAFVCHRGLFHWTRLPMGLCNASQLFQRAMEVVLKGLIGNICMLYIDDIVVYSANKEEHVQHLQELFDRFRRYNLRLNPAKCVFGLRQVKLLGYIVSADGLAADPDKVNAIARMGPPQNLAETRSFLGMSGYYRTCIRDYARIAEPLVELTRKNVRFKWTERRQRAFEDLKQDLVSDSVMAHPQTDKPYLLYTDACDYAIGGILCQTDDQGIERPIVYLSKQLSATQRRWATIEKEAYAVIYALKQLRPYLWGAEYRTFTDHKPLTSLFTKDLNNTKIQRWAVLMSEYNCKVEYHKGKLNIRADMLSRIRQNEHISTFDVDHWHLGDALPDLQPDDPAPDVYGLDLQQLSQQQRTMPEWSEHFDDDSAYQVINGLLYSTRPPHKYAPDYPRLVLPPQQRERVVERAHLEVGHMSTHKTVRKLQEAFVWPRMRAEVDQLLAKCPVCIVHSKTVPRAPMGEMPIATAPVQIVGMDLIGPLIKTPGGCQYILTLVDHCSGWAEAFPIPAKTSYEVWKKLSREYFPRHGYPDVIINDQGLEFGAKSLKDYLKDVGIDQRRTTSYNPQSNGKCERLNGTLKTIISRLINNARDSWEDQLGPALMAYNNALSTTTGHTPYFLHYGRRARLPINRLLSKEKLCDERLQDVADALRTAASLTADARRHNRERLAKQANAGKVKVGDTVVIKAQEPLSLTSRWDPQWTVTRVRDKVIWVTHQQTGRQKTLNINKVKLVDPHIAWDQIHQRPVRNPRQGPRISNRAPPPAMPLQPNDSAHPGEPATPPEESVDPRPSKKPLSDPPCSNAVKCNRRPPKRSRSPDHDRADTNAQKGLRINPSRPRAHCSTVKKHSSGNTPAVKTSPGFNSTLHPTPAQPSTSGPSTLTSSPAAHEPLDTTPAPSTVTPLPSAHRFTQHHQLTAPASPAATTLPQLKPRSSSVHRPAPQRTVDTKRLLRQAPRRPHDPEFEGSAKRSRPFLPRGTKRNITAPPLQQQKKAKAEVIAYLSQWTSTSASCGCSSSHQCWASRSPPFR